MNKSTNKELIEEILNFIEDHLYDENLNLDCIALHFGYSKYHLHRLFTALTHFPLHTYIQRRRLSEAGGLLVKTNQRIIEIALQAGYASQRSFSKAFKNLYHVTPNTYRRKQKYNPVQVKYEVSETCLALSETKIFDVRIEEKNHMLLVGVKANTSKGFGVIGRCWYQLHKYKHLILNRIDNDFVVGINDYSHFEKNGVQPCFDYYAVAEVEDLKDIPAKMITKTLPASQYIVFSLKGHNEESMQEIVEYIYGQWFLETTLLFNQNCMYDFVKYGEQIDEQGVSLIEYWIPVLDSCLDHDTIKFGDNNE